MTMDEPRIESLVCTFVSERTGSSLSKPQRARLLAAMEQRRAGRDETVYLAHLRSPEGSAELAELMASISVHKTDLFRDLVQLEAFRKNVLTALVAQGRPLRLWSAGCATGEEVATLLILLAEAGAHPASSVLGTDISTLALDQAKTLSFPKELMGPVSEPLRSRYFRQRGDRFELADSLRAKARFSRHNLMDFPYPFAADGSCFDVIFCRNVLIYFTEAAFDRTVAGLRDRLAMGATLVLSAAEPILKTIPGLSVQRCDQAFFYRREELPVAPIVVARAVPPPPVKRPVVEPMRPAPPVTSPAPAPELHADPRAEAVHLFEQALERAAADDTSASTEQALRKCLYLDPHFSQARYLLGVLLEQGGARADAAAEYRRALAALHEGKATSTPFFLNAERLKVACTRALERLGFRPGAA